MARDSDGLAIRKWANNSGLVLAPTDITPADGLPVEYGVDTFLSLEVFNYLWRQVTGLGEDVAQHGVLEWDAAQEYLHPSFVVGSDHNLYQSVQASGGSNTSQDPTTDSSGTYWGIASNIDIAIASESTPGIIRTATIAEVLAGTSLSTAVTPANLAAVTNHLLTEASNALTQEPGEYVFSESGAKTWPWNTTKGRVVIDYIDTGIGRQEGLTLQNSNVVGDDTGWRGLANDGVTFWVVGKRFQEGSIIRAWTINGVRDSDKDIATDNDYYYGITYFRDNLLLGVSARSQGPGVYTINTVSGNQQQVIATTTDDYRGITTDGDTVWVVNDTTHIVEAYSATDWSRQSGKDITLGYWSNSIWGGAATDGDTVWVYHSQLLAALAWTISTKTRDYKKDFALNRVSTRGVDTSAGLTVNNSILHIITREVIGSSLLNRPRILERYKLTPDRELVVGDTSYGVGLGLVGTRNVVDDWVIDSGYDRDDFKYGIASDGTTIWGIIVDGSRNSTAKAWKVADGTRDTSKDITLSIRGFTAGAFIHDNKLFTLNESTGTVDSYNIATKSFIKSFTVSSGLGQGNHRGVTSDGSTVWVVIEVGGSNARRVAEAYSLADGSRLLSKDIPLQERVSDAATDGTTIWFARRLSNFIFEAWDIATLSRTSRLDIELNPSYFKSNENPGMDINGSVMYVRWDENLIYYQLAASDQKFGPGHYEVTGASIGDTIRVTLKDEEDFAIVYPVY